MLDLGQQKKTDEIPLRRDEDGAARIGDTQVTLDVLMAAYDQGATPEQIVQKFGELALPDVYSVIGFYLRHEDDVRHYLAERAKQAGELRTQIESEPSNRTFRERLLRLKREKTGSGSGT